MEVIQVQEDSVSEKIISRFQDEIEGINKKNATLKKELATKVEIEKQLLEEMLILQTRIESLIKEKDRQQDHAIQSNLKELQSTEKWLKAQEDIKKLKELRDQWIKK